MNDFNPFRISFDRPLKAAERTRARATATVVGAAAIFLGLSSLAALLNASSETIGTWTNAEPPPEARLLTTEAEDPAGKSCEEQTWPYLEARCLTSTDAQASPRSTPKHGLGAQQISLPDVPVTPASRSPEPATTGAAARDDNSDHVAAEATGATNGSAVPLPVPAPATATSADTDSVRAIAETDAARQRGEAAPQLAKRQQQRLQRQERKRLQRQRREARKQEARKQRHERLRARHQARRDDDIFFIFR